MSSSQIWKSTKRKQIEGLLALEVFESLSHLLLLSITKMLS